MICLDQGRRKKEKPVAGVVSAAPHNDTYWKISIGCRDAYQLLGDIKKSKKRN